MVYNTDMEPVTTTGVQVSKVKTGIKDFFLYVGFFAVLYTLIGNFINFAFSVINSVFPDYQYSYRDPYGSSMRMSIAIMVVLTPILIGLARKMHKDLREVPEKTSLWVRRWGLYTTLSLTIITLASDLVTLIYKFLGGEMSARFVWKVAVLAVLSGFLWLYTHSEIKGAFSASPKKSLYTSIALSLTMIAVVITGVSLMGSPSFLRQVRDDNTRESNLSTIQYRVINYYRNKGELPISLNKITEGDPGASVLPVDPKTGNEYGYSVLPPRVENNNNFISFNLCADFEQDGTADDKVQKGKAGQTAHVPSVTYDSYYGYDYSNTSKVVNYDDHGIGQKCFTVEINTALNQYKPYNSNTNTRGADY